MDTSGLFQLSSCQIMPGDEGHGSILSYLKDMGWATDLCAGAGGDNFSHSSRSSEDHAAAAKCL